MNAAFANDKLSYQQFLDELRGNILPFWMQHTPDRENGGFFGALSNDLQVHNEVERSAVVCSRILWTFSTATRLYDDETYRRTAQWAFDYISSRFWDEKYGGIYWALDRSGRPVNDRKHTYAQAFAIYGLAEYSRATGDAQSLVLAQKLFELVETHTFDPLSGGNLECCTREWGRLDDMRLSLKDFNSHKSMNTLLHLLEAYTNLARVWPDARLREKLRGLIVVFLEHIVDSSTGHQRLFFDQQWHSLTELISYGHDIETSWLLVEAAEVLGDPALLAQTRSLSVNMAQVVYDQSLGADGSIRYEALPGGHLEEENFHWWAHAEAVVGFYNAYQVSGQAHFAQASARVWEYIQAHFVDHQRGDWFKLLDPTGKPILSHFKVGPWECPYHHARMCYEMLQRLAAV